MGRDISILISAKDNYSTALQKMQKTQTSFRKDLGQLSKELDRLNQNKISLKTDFSKAKTELKAAEQAFKATGNEASRLQLEAAQANYNNVKSNLDLVSKAARQTERDMQNLTGTMSKTENRAAGTGDTLSKLATAGLGAMVGNAAANLGGSLLSSALGSETGNAITSMLSGAATGAAMGSIAGPVGTAIGAAAGLATGAIQAITQGFENRDDAYRTAVQDLYTDITSGRAEQVAGGSDTAGTREQRQIAFSTLLGDAGKADQFLTQLREFAAETPFGEDQLASMSKTLLAYNYQASEILPLLTAVGDAGSALGMTSDDMVNVAIYLGRMQTTGKTTMEYLNPLMERGIPVFDYLATSMGKTKAEVQEMVSKGLIPGQDAARVIADYMGGSYAGNMAKQAETYAGMISTLEDAQKNIDAAMGEGYNTERKKGIDEQISYLEGEGGKKLQEANRLIGAYEASLENKQEELERTAIDEAFERIKTEGITDAAEMGRILQEAKANAAIEYANTTEYQSQVDAQTALVDSIQAAMQEPYYMAGYNMGQNLTQGILAAYTAMQIPGPVVNADGSANLPALESFKSGKAFGQGRVPYDNYPVLLHEGEEVRTAGQSRRDRAAGGRVVISGNNFTIREEADIQKVAAAIVDELETRQLGYVG